MHEQQTPVTLRTKWSKKKVGLLVLALIFLTGTLLFQLASEKIRQAVEQSLLAQANQSINGKITVGNISLSFLGYVEADDIEVLNAAGNPVAKINRVHIRYNLHDLLKGQLGPQLITGVTVEEPEIWLTYQQEHSNWDNLLKPTSDDSAKFSGKIKLKNGQLHLTTDLFEKTVNQLSGQFDFLSASQTSLTITGQLDQAALTAEGHWGTDALSEITITAKGLDLTKLGLVADDSPIKITAGKLDEVTAKLGNGQPGGTVLLKTLAGHFSGVDTTGALALSQGSADFTKQEQSLLFTNGQALYKGQPITVNGQLITTSTAEQALDFTIQMPAGDPTALLPNLQTGGNIAVQGKVTGSVLAPVLSGSFSLDRLQFGTMTVSGINGTFSYAQEQLKLLTATGATTGGTVSASGNIYPDSEQYSLNISGSGLDSSQLTTKDVHGPLSLTGTATGNAAAALLQGSFTITSGKAYGVSFQTLTGNFVKQGSNEAEVSNLAMKTDFGTFYPEQISQNVMEQLQQRNLPTSRAEAEKKITEKLTDKVLEKLLR
ncbi:AsmA family protein [Propionispora hippei]|uniref:AsmA domain-containing protein n=1 Tax=Propionispora hippei DSM 15287 TaxID=1123003 RepID=A0A1M6I9B2_9FIRM|nr:hypothetical protein [Propionispora hippei]SHJ31041.1 hypothetical protein SAMN02745170_02234 [Propionispora hippei DSM 15287]